MDAASVARSNVGSFATLIGTSPGGRVLDTGGVTAVVCTAAPERPLLNAVFPSSAGALADRYGELEDLFGDVGAHAFTVWVSDGDRAAAALLAERGHTLDGRPRLMAAPCAAIARPSLALEAVDPPQVADVAALNDAVYGYPGSFGRALGPDLAARAMLVAAADAGRTVACSAGILLGTDLHVTMTATLPEHRGRGLASALVGRLVEAGQATGAATTSLVATAAGAPVYARLGYRDVGAIEMWERRLS